MSDKIKIMDLAELPAVADGDWIVIVDVSDTTQSPEGTTKRVRKSLLKGVNWQGDWAAGSYVSDDGVSYNGSSWIANKTTTEEPSIVATDWDVLAIKGDTGATGPQGVQGIQGVQGDKGNQWQGAWVAGTYQIDDVVENDGSSWIATAVTTEEPSNFATDWDLFAAKGVDGAGSGDMLKINYDPANKNADAFEMDNMDEGTDTKIMTAAERTKLGHISVTQAVDLDQMEADIAALVNGMVYKGNWDATSGSFPGAGVAQTGWFYTVSVGGTVDGVVFVAGDRLIATVDNASTTTFASNWTQVDATDSVQSVAGLVGVILASALRTALNVGEIIDEDNMASNDATKVPSQQSVKTYVDSLTGNLKKTLSASIAINGSVTPVPIAIQSDGTIVPGDANGGTALQKFFGFVTGDTGSVGLGAQLNNAQVGAFNGSVTANAGTDRVLLIGFCIQPGTAPSALTWNGISGTVVSSDSQGTTIVQVWRFVIGTSGSNQTFNLVPTGGTGTVIAFSSVHSYIDQASPIAHSATAKSASQVGVLNCAVVPTQYRQPLVGFGCYAGNPASFTTGVTDVQDGGSPLSSMGQGFSAGAISTNLGLLKDSGASITGVVIVGVALKNSSLPTIPVTLNGLIAGFTGLTRGSYYYLSDTSGTIQTTPGTNTVLLGKAVSTTELLIVQA